MPTESEIDIIQFNPIAKGVPKNHLVLGLDRQSGEPFGNAAFGNLDATLCASYDGVTMIQAGKKGVLFPLSWLCVEYPKERKIWEAQCDALRRYARQNDLPFIEPFSGSWKANRLARSRIC
jgi:hypothetical protein